MQNSSSNLYSKHKQSKSYSRVLLGLVGLITLSLISLNLLNNNQVRAAAPSGFGVSIDTTAGAVDYNTGDSGGNYLGVRIKLVSPSNFNIKSDLNSLGFVFVKSSEIETKCTDLNKDDGSQHTGTNAITGITAKAHGTSNVNDYYHTFRTVTNSNQLRIDRVFVKKSAITSFATKNYKICVEIPYQRPGSTETMYAYVATSTEFTTALPKVTKITVKSADYTAADIGEDIEIVYTFNRPVKIVVISHSDNYEQYKNIITPIIGTGIGRRTAVNGGNWSNKSYRAKAIIRTSYSKDIVFKPFLGLSFDMDASGKTGAKPVLTDNFFETGNNAHIGVSVVSLGSNGRVNGEDPSAQFDIVDEHGRKVQKITQNKIIATDDAEVSNFKVTIDTTPIVTLKQVAGGFDITHTPEKFEFYAANAFYNYDIVTSTPQNTITANWTLLKRTTLPQTADKCETGAGITTVATGTKAIVKEEMPNTPDNMWYCVHTVDVFNRKVSSKWMKYVNDTTGPVISHTVVNNRLTFTVTDAGTGYKEGSLRWGALLTDNYRCAPGFSDNFGNNAMTLIVTENIHDGVICVKAEDNSGNVSYKKITLKYNQPTTTTNTDDDEKPEATTDDMDKDTDTTDQGTTQTTTTVNCNNLPDNWNTLTVNEKVRLNPCKCNDTTQIRADNGQCLSGGHSRTATTDDGETTTPAPPITGDDNTMDDDMMDDEDNTDDTVGDDETVDNDLAEIILSFNDEDKVLTLTASGGELSNWMYTIIESGQCSSDMDGYQTVDGNTVTVTQDDIDNEKTVCVKANRSDSSTVTQPYQLGQTTPSDETTPGDETGNESSDETTDDDGTNPILIIGIVVLVIVVIGVIIFMVTKNKNNNQV